jgi:hypothetical protein
LLAANQRLNTADLLKESFGQRWSYERAGWARRFFANWRASLKWQRLKPHMINRYWDGIAAYCRPENKVSFGFVEGHPCDPTPRLWPARRGLPAAQDPHLHAADPVADSTPSRAASRILLGAASTQAMRCRHCADRPRGAADIAVDMMDNASALPTRPQRQQQQKTALQKCAKITHTTSRRGIKFKIALPHIAC